ncbi:hypothetical protein GCM10023216_01020 [Isoptericola chiayiensis]|uniref:Uncharacterized protein n=1 Tax=Isoptericola chiayiensis TaxID=579446 RepID=A0ABP8XWQ1_9MICO
MQGHDDSTDTLGPNVPERLLRETDTERARAACDLLLDGVQGRGKVAELRGPPPRAARVGLAQRADLRERRLRQDDPGRSGKTSGKVLLARLCAGRAVTTAR